MVNIHPIMSGKHNPTMAGKLRPAIDTRVWGILKNSVSHDTVDRSIPTCVGNTAINTS